MCLRRTRSFCLRHREEPLRENHTGPTGEKGIGRIENLLQAGPEKSKEIIYSAEAENLVVTTGFSIVQAQRVAKQIQGSGFGRNTLCADRCSSDVRAFLRDGAGIAA